jgi:hypothetical protein
VIAIQQNYDCSITISQDQANQAVGTGWTVLLANPLNNTDVRPISPRVSPLLPSVKSCSHDLLDSNWPTILHARVGFCLLLFGSPAISLCFFFSFRMS